MTAVLFSMLDIPRFSVARTYSDETVISHLSQHSQKKFQETMVRFIIRT